MSKQRSWCCGFIPGFWWWFLTLVGLPLMFLLMTYFRQGVVESDLTNRVSMALNAENVGWAEVDVEHRGRDVLLKGIPPDEAERERVLNIAQGVYGVHQVDFDSDVPVQAGTEAESAIIMPTLNAALRDGKLILQGSLPAQQQIDQLVGAANRRFGGGNVSNQLVVGKGVATPQWLSSADDLLDIIPDQDALLSISDQGIELTAEVNDEAAKEGMLFRARELLGAEVTDSVSVKSLLPPEVEMAMSDGKVILNGSVASEQQAERLVQAAAARVGAEKVDNQLEVNPEYAEAGWMDSVVRLMSDGLPGENGVAKIADGKLELNADVASAVERDQLVAQSNAVLQDSGLILVNNITVTPSKAAETTQVAVPAASQLTAQACQAQLDAAMTDKNILFQVNKADIRNESYALLDGLAAIVTDCKDTLVGQWVTIGGHTDSDGSANYNLDLSQRRADAVLAYLSGKGVATSLLTAKGFGESQPVASNNNAAGKAQNRRISFEIQAAE